MTEQQHCSRCGQDHEQKNLTRLQAAYRAYVHGEIRYETYCRAVDESKRDRELDEQRAGESL